MREVLRDLTPPWNQASVHRRGRLILVASCESNSVKQKNDFHYVLIVTLCLYNEQILPRIFFTAQILEGTQLERIVEIYVASFVL
jgi:hypothetical protein